ncbi:MAG: hypothetical protein QM756_08725 [Polyangiaceae bacterium]
MSIRPTLRSAVSLLGSFTVVACSAGTSGQSQGNGGSSASGGALQGGAANGGSANGGNSAANGGSANGGASTANGGSSSGGGSSGGSSAANGGSASGGSANGGSANGGAPQGGSGGAGNGGSSSGGVAGGAASGGSGTAGSSASGCAKSGLLFCDDFEKYSAGPAPTTGGWSTSFIGPDTPSIVVDGTTAHSGTRSVVVHAPNTNFQSFIIYHDAAVLPRTQGDFYMRVFVRLGRDMATMHNAYIVLDRFAAPGGGSAVRLGEDTGMLSLTVGGDAQGTLSNAKFSQNQILGPHFVSKTWACLEGYFNSTKPEIDFWLDGAEIADFHHTNWTADAYDTVRLGFEKYAGPELDIWFDDFALGATRVGCN